MLPPKWFTRALEIIDSTYFVVFNREYQYYEIKKEMNVVKDGRLVIVRPTLAVFRRLNDRALDNLRERKFVGRKFSADPMRYLKYLNSLNEEAKAKKRELAMEIMVHGLMKIHELGRKKIFT